MLPGPGLSLGLAEASRFSFGISATVAPILMALLFYRVIAGPALPEALRPTWFILLVPPSLIYANGLALFPEVIFLENLFYFALALARRAPDLRARVPALALRPGVVGLYLPARRAGVRRRALRAGPPVAALARGLRGDAAARDGRGADCPLANASQRCIAAGVNSACGWLPPMMNISRCSLFGSS